MVLFAVHYLVQSVKLHNDIQQGAHKLLFGKEDLYGGFFLLMEINTVSKNGPNHLVLLKYRIISTSNSKIICIYM